MTHKSSDARATLGADIGGTFTDVVLETGDRQYSTKVLTTHGAPEDALISGMLEVCANAEVPPAAISRVIHGTTLATNALIERRGAHTALITTEGFRDVIEMRTESRFEQYDLNLELPEPLLSREHRYVLPERMDAHGQVLRPLSTDALAELLPKLAAGGYNSVAVGLLHSYANDAHEQQVRAALQHHLPDVMVSLSSEVSPQMREYERFNTTVANAYIKPLMKSYLDRLAGRLADTGAACPVFLMHSGGGIISLASAAEFPVRLVESGPAGGAVFAAHIAARHGLPKVLSFDMGGTTAKICLIRDQTPKTSRVFEVARSYRFKKGSGMPISIPVIDMVEIGAGGGSLASVDSLQQIRVGPRSAGSEPGPACYGRGGQEPAVTDADVALGRLDPQHFAGGSFSLDANASHQALATVIGTPLSLDPVQAAFGVAEVVDENMANAARVHAVENGEDLAGYTMIAFGGAAPLHAGRLCEKLGIKRCLIPPGAGVGSAIGFLRSPFSFEATRSVFMQLDQFDAEHVSTLLHELEAEASRFVAECDINAATTTVIKVYMRYTGQGWEIPVSLPAAVARVPDACDLRQRFESAYQQLFGRTVTGLGIDMTVWAVTVSTELTEADPVIAIGAHRRVTADERRPLFDPAEARVLDAAVMTRATLAAGDALHGPAAITEAETTIIVPASRQVICQSDGCIDMQATT